MNPTMEIDNLDFSSNSDSNDLSNLYDKCLQVLTPIIQAYKKKGIAEVLLELNTYTYLNRQHLQQIRANCMAANGITTAFQQDSWSIGLLPRGPNGILVFLSDHPGYAYLFMTNTKYRMWVLDMTEFEPPTATIVLHVQIQIHVQSSDRQLTCRGLLDSPFSYFIYGMHYNDRREQEKEEEKEEEGKKEEEEEQEAIDIGILTLNDPEESEKKEKTNNDEGLTEQNPLRAQTVPFIFWANDILFHSHHQSSTGPALVQTMFPAFHSRLDLIQSVCTTIGSVDNGSASRHRLLISPWFSSKSISDISNMALWREWARFESPSIDNPGHFRTLQLSARNTHATEIGGIPFNFSGVKLDTTGLFVRGENKNSIFLWSPVLSFPGQILAELANSTENHSGLRYRIGVRSAPRPMGIVKNEKGAQLERVPAIQAIGQAVPVRSEQANQIQLVWSTHAVFKTVIVECVSLGHTMFVTGHRMDCYGSAFFQEYNNVVRAMMENIDWTELYDSMSPELLTFEKWIMIIGQDRLIDSPSLGPKRFLLRAIHHIQKDFAALLENTKIQNEDIHDNQSNTIMNVQSIPSNDDPGGIESLESVIHQNNHMIKSTPKKTPARKTNQTNGTTGSIKRRRNDTPWNGHTKKSEKKKKQNTKNKNKNNKEAKKNSIPFPTITEDVEEEEEGQQQQQQTSQHENHKYPKNTNNNNNNNDDDDDETDLVYRTPSDNDDDDNDDNDDNHDTRTEPTKTTTTDIELISYQTPDENEDNEESNHYRRNKSADDSPSDSDSSSSRVSKHRRLAHSDSKQFSYRRSHQSSSSSSSYSPMKHNDHDRHNRHRHYHHQHQHHPSKNRHNYKS